ncbi:MAG: hypothetical protein FWG74_02930, partial [Planctomycetes bacterium]|nr:hypothetical protein [Planctomycetota bacterium]
MKNKWGYILLFALMVCAVVYISIPSDDTLIEMSRKVGNPFRVRQLLQRRFEQEPTNVKIALELARVARQLGDRRTELETLRVANRRRPDDPGVRRTLAVTLMEVGQVEEALG